MDTGDLATWAATFVSVAAMVLSILASKDANKKQEEVAALTKRNLDLFEKQHQLKLKSWTEQYFSDVRNWAEQVCGLISEGCHIVNHPNENEERAFDVLIRLSALIDTGRWYFPNQWSDEYGTHKPAAYRGLRQPVLDCLVDAYDCLASDEAMDKKSRLIEIQRDFVSHIQTVLDPRKREHEITKVLKEFEVSERLRNAP
ncbi:MAG: hypothetical protein ACK4FK_12120 [Ferrovibrio sp.]|uniref:hypothetical protein n=1 Tax=Ferrovibrio sp. TaxID=1917215 RepID=UPI00391BA85A